MSDDMSSVIKASEISSLSDTQVKVLSILPLIPAVGSICASSTIVFMIWKSHKRTVYRRLLLGMSLCDVCMSVFAPLQAFLLPRETSQRVWAVGNDATCSMMGFMSQFSFAILIYSTILSFYFLMTVRYGMREEKIAKFEPYLHLFAIGYPFITATIGVAKDMFREVELSPMCWVTDYPENCGDDPGETGEPCKGELIAWIFGGLLIFPTLICLVVNNSLIYRHVRHTVYSARRRSSVPIDTSNDRNSLSRNRNQQREADSQVRRVQEVAKQAFLYVFSFSLSYIWTIFLRLMESAGFNAEDESSVFFLLVLQALFYPSQGMWNLLVYVRPKYSRSRKDFPYESRFWCFLRALFEEDIKPRHSRPNMGSSETAREDPSNNMNLSPGDYEKRSKVHAIAISGWLTAYKSSDNAVEKDSSLQPQENSEESTDVMPVWNEEEHGRDGDEEEESSE